MQVFDHESHILVVGDTLGSRLCVDPVFHRPLFKNEYLYLFDVSKCLGALEVLASKYSVALSPRYMDRFYFAFGETGESRQELLTAFFDQIANQYSELVNSRQNSDNIRQLLGLVDDLSGTLSDLRILDFGCGVGLSLDVAKAMSCTLVGFDVCPNMRTAAAAKGMVVWGPRELSAQSYDSIDAAIASYVFHLRPGTGSLQLVWSRMRPGGLLVANLHKNEGGDVLFPCMEDLGATELSIPLKGDHGTYVGFVKGG